MTMIMGITMEATMAVTMAVMARIRMVTMMMAFA